MRLELMIEGTGPEDMEQRALKEAEYFFGGLEVSMSWSNVVPAAYAHNFYEAYVTIEPVED